MIRRFLPAFAFLLVSAPAPAVNPLLDEHSVRALERAKKDMETRNRLRAEAVLKSLLLERVRVGIDASSLPSNARLADDFVRGVRDGIALWSEVLPDSPFVFANSGERPDVTIRFLPQIDGDDQIQGFVQVERRFMYGKSGANYRMDGTIRVRDNVQGRDMSRDEVGRVTAHELGHLLGLDDRYRSNGIMGAFIPGPGRRMPTEAELLAVRTFRGETRDALRRIYAAQRKR